MGLLDWLRRRREEAEEGAYEAFAEETWVNGEQVPNDEIITTGEGEGDLPTLRKGDRGDEVKLLQETLIALGFSCGKAGADGIFGSGTKAAVKDYQKAHALGADGVVGRQTWTALGLMEPQVYADGTQPPDFKQYDKRWAGKMYSSHGDKKQTMKSSGCGPTAMADIVAAWWDRNVTPYELALKSLDWGTRTKNSGTASTFFRKVQAEYKAGKYLTRTSLDDAIQCLQEGGLVVCCFGAGTKGKPGYRKWTKGGHYACIWKYDGTYFHINDPASAASARAKGTRTEVANTRKGFYLFWR
ncbi:MAG: peptidoglycan-binding protein [Clostridiales bacterium]|nr:peptidoglycan-binding protein [Clostridiales bacterium]